jgi:3-oxoacyl-[acyl-carrier protein] reductase
MNGYTSEPDEKIALITGSSRGIGRATTIRLAEDGVSVIINYLKCEKEAKETAQEIRKMGCRAFPFQADVRNFEETQNLVSFALKKFGKIDILVNNAGIVQDRTLQKMAIEEWESVIRTNLTGVFYCSKLVVQDMIRRKVGRIINICSVVGQVGNFGQTNYAAAKAGILGFTKSLALEVASVGITVNAVCPGFIETDMIHKLPGEIKEKILKKIPLKRFGQPREVAELIAFLASEHSSYITGQTFNINGGLFMGTV